MTKTTLSISTVILAMLMLAATQPLVAQEPGSSEPSWGGMKNQYQHELLTSATVEGLAKARPRPQTWVDCELFDGVVTPASFNPESDPFDELYTGGNGFNGGVPLISESKPGDADYNGGRWHANVLKAGVDPNKYSNACTVEDLDLSDFESTANYFECPLLPRRGRRPAGP